MKKAVRPGQMKATQDRTNKSQESLELSYHGQSGSISLFTNLILCQSKSIQGYCKHFNQDSAIEDLIQQFCEFHQQRIDLAKNFQ